MNLCQLENIKEIDKLLGLAIEHKVESMAAIEKAKKLAEELIEFKDFDTWKFVQD